MYSIEEIEEVMQNPTFMVDIRSIRQSLVNKRLKKDISLNDGSENRLKHFIESVLASSVEWGNSQRIEICTTAGEICEILATKQNGTEQSRLMRVRAALLYELSGLPSLSATILKDNDLPELLVSFFRRKGLFTKLNGFSFDDVVIDTGHIGLGELAFIDDALSYGNSAQQNQPFLMDELLNNSVSSIAWKIGEVYDLGLSATEIRAFSSLLQAKIRRSTVQNINTILIPDLRKMGFPIELLPAQNAAIKGGMLNSKILSWGFSAPTGTGKTFLSRLLIADLLFSFRGKKIIYLVPSKALVSEVAFDLKASFKSLNYSVLALSAQLVDLDDRERIELQEASVIVMTPEKADMLLRLGAEFLNEVRLVIIDEAHHIETGTRGALLELYLWRLKCLLNEKCRYIFLSAVAPNIKDIAQWIDPKGDAISFSHRSTRMRVGIYKLIGSGISASSSIHYTDGTSVEIAPSMAETAKRKGICQLAEFLSPAGPILVVAKGKKECENIANELKKYLKEQEKLPSLSTEEKTSDSYKSLDACLAREMYDDIPLRKLLTRRIAYHHAGLPPNVRHGVEQAIRNHQIDYVIATTTLAEGVNFPFSSVVIQSLSLREPPEKGRPSRYSPVSPRTFWNIAGRAGRPGFDTEGQVILYEPSLGLDKINAVIDTYLDPNMASLAPVKSALIEVFQEIKKDLDENSYSLNQIQKVKLPEQMSRRAKGAINLLRIGLMHSRATKIISSPEEIVDSLFAVRFFQKDMANFAKKIMISQEEAMNSYLAGGDVPDMNKLSELGLSLETLNDLRDYVHNMKDWQLESCSRLFYGSRLNLEQAQYIIGPIAKRMSELEGPSLGGYLSDIIIKWLSGITFTVIHRRSKSKFAQRVEDLVSVIYSRVQYLLPWGLWATDWIIEQETKRRHINYDNQVKKLAYLADAGVPNFDALHLTHLKFERVDSTRLSHAYLDAGGLATGSDCLGWIIAQPNKTIEKILHGQDRRRIEYKFFDQIAKLKKHAKKSESKADS